MYIATTLIAKISYKTRLRLNPTREVPRHVLTGDKSKDRTDSPSLGYQRDTAHRRSTDTRRHVNYTTFSHHNTDEKFAGPITRWRMRTRETEKSSSIAQNAHGLGRHSSTRKNVTITTIPQFKKFAKNFRIKTI